MLFTNAETLAAIAAIAAGAKKWTKNELEAVLALARARKPAGLDAASRGAQARYSGTQAAVIREALAKRFPETKNMPVAAIPWLKMLARLDAGVYVVEPDRFLEDENGARVDADGELGKLWSWALDRSRFHTQMAEAERRALVTPGCVFGEVVWMKPPGDPVGYPKINLYWPHDIEVLCHWSAPTSFDFAYVVALRQASPDTKSRGTWYKVYSREPPKTSTGEWGKWRVALVSTEGEQAADAFDVDYAGEKLPVFLVQLTDPEGSVFACVDTDLLDVVDDLNVRRSNESFVVDLQGHDQLWTDDNLESATVKGGPDAIMRGRPGSVMEVLSLNPKLDDMRASRELALRELATARGNSPHAYVTKASGPPQSGVAMRIENATHDQRVAEQAALMHVIEEAQPLPILKDVIATFHPAGIRMKEQLVGARARMTPRKPPMFEDPAQRQLRLGDAVNRGWISDARAAADAELYPDEKTAQRAIDALEASAPEPETPDAPPAPPPANGPAPAREGEDDQADGVGSEKAP